MLRDWTSWCRVKTLGEQQGLTPLIADLESGALQPHEARSAFDLAYARWWLPQALDADATLRDFRRFQHEHAVQEFREIDDLVRAKATARVVGALAHGLPAVQSVPRNSELGLLRQQMELQRPSRSIRDMIGAMPGSFGKLAPCMLMSTESLLILERELRSRWRRPLTYVVLFFYTATLAWGRVAARGHGPAANAALADGYGGDTATRLPCLVLFEG